MDDFVKDCVFGAMALIGVTTKGFCLLHRLEICKLGFGFKSMVFSEVSEIRVAFVTGLELVRTVRLSDAVGSFDF